MLLPKGIITFVIAVTGLCVSLPLMILWVGLPLLALTLACCRSMMSSEWQFAQAWSHGSNGGSQQMTDPFPAFRWEGLRTLGLQLRQEQSYRGILYSLLQLPAGILAFTLAVVFPSVAIAGLLSPAVQKISTEVFLYDPNMLDPEFFFFLANTSSDQRSWIVCAFGFVLLLFLPLILNGFGRQYSAWIRLISGSGRIEQTQPELVHSH
ncbi:sensor domain-containing protein [Paenibacillus sp. MMS20-IR301]|uniref:sensor domain-containing protein n=1 Tax=Paenibacillus sp. MMS20-IR301 TaxID=2895946 RepID=UPI0028E2C470|nr:sensor domain-containing protein [Paenibacillus sp. MMS20-IR301]WNS41153.1 sensor domain-containing protein [Paenibacillus sp. MMS20-IR301]